MMIMPVDNSVWLDKLNSVSRQASTEIEEHGWIQDQMTGENGELCIIAAGHEASTVVEAPGMSHVLREVLDYLDHDEGWNDTPGREAAEITHYLDHLQVTEDVMYETFGPDWTKVCYLSQMFSTFTAEEMRDWSDDKDQVADWELLKHLDSQQEPLPQEVRARTAVCAAASHMAIEHNLNPMGPSVALMTSFIIRPSLQGALA